MHDDNAKKFTANLPSYIKLMRPFRKHLRLTLFYANLLHWNMSKRKILMTKVWRRINLKARTQFFSNSLIIYQVRTKKITTLKEVWPGYPVIISINLTIFFSVNSLFFSIKMIHQTLEAVFHRLSKHKNTRCASYFQLSSQCLDISMKHYLSCLIYYIFVFSLV